MSLGGGYWSGYDTPVANLEAAGVVTVVAAGNENTDLKTKSPAHVLKALTVRGVTERGGCGQANGTGPEGAADEC